MWDTVILIVLVVWCLLCTLATMVRLPGTWLILLAACGYAWWRGGNAIDFWTLVILFVVAVAGELVEIAASAVTARRAGATRQAAWGGLLGGILGAVFLSFLVPIPLVGTVAGALAGCFLGAVMGELTVHRRIGQGARVGWFSAIGFGLGMIAKVALALAMSGVVILAAVSHRHDSVGAGSEPPDPSRPSYTAPPEP